MIVGEMKTPLRHLRGATPREGFRCLLDEEDFQAAYEVLNELFAEDRSVSAVADFFGVDVSTIARWCDSVSRATRKKDPRALHVSRRVAKTEFGKVVIENPAGARAILKELQDKYGTIAAVSEKLGVKRHTVRRWKKALGLVE